MRLAIVLTVAVLAACGSAPEADKEDGGVAQVAATGNLDAEIVETPEPEPTGPAVSAKQSDGFARAREDIEVFCDGDAECSREQRQELGYFVNMMAAFNDPGGAVAERCLRSGKGDRGVDWTIATPCMREAVKGKPLGATIS